MMKCNRCGWQGGTLPSMSPKDALEQLGLSTIGLAATDITDTPEIELHPEDGCPSPFRVDETVIWNGAGHADDLPPIFAKFVKISEFCGPAFELTPDGEWDILQAPQPVTSLVEVYSKSLLPRHLEIFPTLGDDKRVHVGTHDLTKPSHWPAVK